MDRAEHASDDLAISVAGRHRGEALFGRGQSLGAFLEEDRLDFVEIVAHGQTFLIAAPSFTGSKGLVIQPVAPAPRARAFFSSENSVDRTKIGVPRNRGRART